MSYQFTNVALIEPVSAADGMLKGNAALYNVINGCAPTYSASNMTVTCAAGSVTHNGAVVSVTGGAAFWTLVADVSNPRWTWLAVDSTGAAVVVSGTAAATPSVPALGDRVAIALVRVEAGQTIADNIATKIDKRIPSPAQVFQKYKTASQVFTTNTTFADITASTGTFSFSIAKNEVVYAHYILPLTFGGTGGVKLQLTGPASPTLVDIRAWGPNVIATGADATYNATYGQASTYLLSSATAFSSSLLGSSSGGVPFTSYGTAGSFTGGLVNGTYEVKAFIVNGSTAGTVTLQGAQASSNSTTTFGSGCSMVVNRSMPSAT